MEILNSNCWVVSSDVSVFKYYDDRRNESTEKKAKRPEKFGGKTILVFLSNYHLFV